MTTEETVTFKKVTRKQFQRKKSSTDNFDIEEDKATELVWQVREAQQLIHKKKHGIDVMAQQKHAPDEKKQEEDIDPFKMKTGGLVEMKRFGAKTGESEEDKDMADMSRLFAKETNQRDEDTLMQKYIEEELSKRRGVKQDAKFEPEKQKPNDVMFLVPEYLRTISKIGNSEETLSHQMLSGIPEVDLGIEEKIRNIEETERAKYKLFKELKEKEKSGESVPAANAAATFVHHKRYDTDSMTTKRRKPKTPVPATVATTATVGAVPPKRPKTSTTGPTTMAASDEFHLKEYVSYVSSANLKNSKIRTGISGME